MYASCTYVECVEEVLLHFRHLGKKRPSEVGVKMMRKYLKI